jgi:hypothetical protein
MKKRTILSLAIVAIVFTVIAFQIQREATAKPGSITITLTIRSTDGEEHGTYLAKVINMRTGDVEGTLPSKIGTYPPIHEGPVVLNSSDPYQIFVCSNQNWGDVTPQFYMINGQNLEFVLTAHFKCPQPPARIE